MDEFALDACDERKEIHIGAFNTLPMKRKRARDRGSEWSQLDGAKRRDFTGFRELPGVCRQTRKIQQPQRQQQQPHCTCISNQHAIKTTATFKSLQNNMQLIKEIHTQIIGLVWLICQTLSSGIERKKLRRCCNKALMLTSKKRLPTTGRVVQKVGTRETNHTWDRWMHRASETWANDGSGGSSGGGVREYLMNIRINKTI